MTDSLDALPDAGPVTLADLVEGGAEILDVVTAEQADAFLEGGGYPPQAESMEEAMADHRSFDEIVLSGADIFGGQFENGADMTPLGYITSMLERAPLFLFKPLRDGELGMIRKKTGEPVFIPCLTITHRSNVIMDIIESFRRQLERRIFVLGEESLFVYGNDVDMGWVMTLRELGADWMSDRDGIERALVGTMVFGLCTLPVSDLVDNPNIRAPAERDFMQRPITMGQTINTIHELEETRANVPHYLPRTGVHMHRADPEFQENVATALELIEEGRDGSR